MNGSDTLETNILICCWSQLHVIKAGDTGQTAREERLRGHFAAPEENLLYHPI